MYTVPLLQYQRCHHLLVGHRRPANVIEPGNDRCLTIFFGNLRPVLHSSTISLSMSLRSPRILATLSGISQTSARRLLFPPRCLAVAGPLATAPRVRFVAPRASFSSSAKLSVPPKMRAVLIKDGKGPAENLYIGEEATPEPKQGEVQVKVSRARLSPAWRNRANITT